jgi:hypothetical protein
MVVLVLNPELGGGEASQETEPADGVLLNNQFMELRWKSKVGKRLPTEPLAEALGQNLK